MSLGKTLAILLLVAAAVVAATAWPRLSDVETGRTPEYPDLRVREYAAAPEAVAGAVREALARLPRWSVGGSGAGPRGIELQAVRTTLVPGLAHEVTVRVRRVGGATRVNVRSRSRVGPWDFGQNARNVRELLAELDRVLGPGRATPSRPL